MPAYQCVAEFDLSRKYHLKAVVCEQCAAHASDPTTEQEWQEPLCNGVRWRIKPPGCPIKPGRIDLNEVRR
jgi:hypothetical protein